jgi:Holliday junction resolvase
MVNPRQKGNLGERQVIELLNRTTQEQWEQTPGSGSGKIKGDLRVHGKHNIFCVEVKFYKHVGFDSKIYTQKSNNLYKWWSKICKQAQQMEQEPLLIFRENHGKFFCSYSKTTT